MCSHSTRYQVLHHIPIGCTYAVLNTLREKTRKNPPATARSVQGGRAAASLVSRPGPVSGPHTTGGAGRPVRPKGGAERQEASQGVPLGPTEES